MRQQAPFQPSDLDELYGLLDSAGAVMAMETVADGNHDERVIGLRHDVDNAIEPAVAMARWEADNGFRSTYFILHTAPYWQQKDLLRTSLETISGCGHEIGFHLNAITAALETRLDPVAIAAEAVGELRGYGYPVRGVVAHGDQACYQHRFLNDEIFLESPRPDWGTPDRMIATPSLKLRPISRRGLGFDYDPNWLPRGAYLSDSGGAWSQPFEEVAGRFPLAGQLHLLIHPDWWPEALDPQRIAA